MELRTYGSQWALPSFDPQCLAAMLILQQLTGRLNKSYSMVDTNDPTEFSSGELPVLIDQTQSGRRVILQGLMEITIHLKRIYGADLDQPLSQQQRAQSAAFLSLVDESLYPAMLHSWWINDENKAIIGKLYAYKMPLSARLRYIYGNQLQQWTSDKLSFVNRASSLSASGDPQVYASVRKSYRTLSTLLDDKQYFFGTDQPTLLDIVVFSHLALHLYADLPHRHLQVILNFEFPALVTYIERFRHVHLPTGVVNGRLVAYSESIWARFQPHPAFPQLIWRFCSTITDECRDLLTSLLPFRDGEQTAKPATTDNEGDALSKADLIFRRNRNISIVGAMSGFLFYVWYRGLVSVEFTNVESADDEEGETAAYRYNSNESVENDENEDDEE